GIIYTDIDVDRLVFERRKANTSVQVNDKSYENIYFNMEIKETVLDRKISRLPFIPSDESERAERCETIISLQYHGLKKRLEHIGCTSAIVGVSGGLDSTLALLITVKAFESLNIPVSGITAVTMPCFGTSDRTYENAKTLMENLGVTIMEVNIKSAVTSHLSDIGSDISHHDVTYENAQARERTQVLMDLANLKGGIVIGTGDLSELALGFATYNGDHMSMYGVNASVPKTLMRYLVTHIANKSEEVLKKTLLDIVATPVSPELLPPESGVITQHTEDIVGPYELHDFFLYYQIRFGCDAEKIKRMCCIAFEGVYKCEEVEKWLNMFTKRFYQNQFKRSCLPDGVKVGSVSLSPRGDFCIPSDVQI
ncbi:MAG: NAD(+) synthase, partial [Oscillospiraceae bacterium]